ncbi:MAG: family 10 glycosylhydrolase [Tannerellaceae bacterium]|nr:family 10 glycosylhydrolase [Tannerellaceae bacterium]MCD8264808.1 family 10 glycosylhydrolase [Tannerellaceae bacterium]
MKNYSWLLLFFFLLFPAGTYATPPKHEVRAVWLTIIYGLDWPDKPATTEEGRNRQKQQLCNILDKLQDANFNTVFLQVRMRGDVIYPSAIEPASAVFSGKIGISPGYDPLVFAIEECHKRGLELHAWFVTFPVGTNRLVNQQGNRSVVKKKPSLCKQHNGEWYLDPGVPETSDYILSLVQELVNNYDLDGIHFDYVRYPEKAKTFPDKAVHRKYGRSLSLDDWRRDNINRMMYRIYDWVKETKPWVQVSSAPLGKYNRIERVPNAGWTAYESVFQDPQQWVLDGKQDMLAPMMYYQDTNFYPFVDDWVANSNGRLFIPGLGAYRMDKKEGDWTKDDITAQLEYCRLAGASGGAFFRCAHILDNTKGIYDELKNNFYKYPALLPPLTWLSDSVPPAPEEILVERMDNELKLSWNHLAPEAPVYYTVYYSYTDTLSVESPQHILATGIRGTELYLPVNPGQEYGFTFCVTASDRYHLESEPSRETFYYFTNYIK